MAARSSVSSSQASLDQRDAEKGSYGSENPSRSTSQDTGKERDDDDALPGPAQPVEPSPLKDWDGPGDAGNPQNWPKWKKIYHTCIPAAIAFVCTLTSSIYTPGRESAIKDLHISSEVANLPYSFYVLGLAFGPLLAAPLSETLGRRLVYMVSMPIFALFILGSGFSSDVASLTVCRFFAGFFGSPGLSIGAATLSDIWLPAERALPMALYVMTPFLGPAIAPIIGGYVAYYKGWRWTQWVTLFFTVVCLTPCLFMKETYKPTLLRRRAKERGVPGASSGRTFAQATVFFLQSTLVRPLHMAFTEPVVGLLTLYIAVNFGILYGFFAALPEVWGKKYGFGIRKTGLTFIGLSIGSTVGAFTIIYFAKTVFRKAAIKARQTKTPVPPEIRLYPAMIGSVALVVSLFWFAWSAQEAVHWICPVIAEGLYGLGMFLIFMSATLYFMDFYGPMYGASAMAANTLIRYIIGAAFPLFVTQMFENLGVGWGISLFGFICVALLPIPFVFYIIGPKLRRMSSYTPSQ